eukprot:m.429775 g.429775  ORF g.429775 m.429775 type:complete len:1127 (-) comp20240_c3_seq2:512-3892(-)
MRQGSRGSSRGQDAAAASPMSSRRLAARSRGSDGRSPGGKRKTWGKQQPEEAAVPVDLGGQRARPADDVPAGYNEYLTLLQERNRLLKKLKHKDADKIEREKQEKGFSLYVNGANTIKAQQRSKTANMNKRIRSASRRPTTNESTASVGPESPLRGKRKNWATNTPVAIRQTQGEGETLFLSPPSALTGDYEDDFDDDASAESPHELDSDRSAAQGDCAEDDADSCSDDALRITLDLDDVTRLRQSLEDAPAVRRWLQDRQACGIGAASVSDSLEITDDAGSRSMHHLGLEDDEDTDLVIDEDFDVEDSLEFVRRSRSPIVLEFQSERPRPRQSLSTAGSRAADVRDSIQSLGEAQQRELYSTLQQLEGLSQPPTGSPSAAEVASHRRTKTGDVGQSSAPRPSKSGQRGSASVVSSSLVGPAWTVSGADDGSQEPRGHSETTPMIKRGAKTTTEQPQPASLASPRSSLSGLSWSVSADDDAGGSCTSGGDGDSGDPKRQSLKKDTASSRKKSMPSWTIDLEPACSSDSVAPTARSSTPSPTPAPFGTTATVGLSVPDQPIRPGTFDISKAKPKRRRVTTVCVCVFSSWSTWDDDVGLTEVQFLDANGKLAALSPSNVTIDGKSSPAAGALVNGRACTTTASHMWKDTLAAGGRAKSIEFVVPATFDLATVRLWNYNAPNSESCGVRKCVVTVNGKVTWDGELPKAKGIKSPLGFYEVFVGNACHEDEDGDDGGGVADEMAAATRDGNPEKQAARTQPAGSTGSDDVKFDRAQDAAAPTTRADGSWSPAASKSPAKSPKTRQLARNSGQSKQGVGADDRVSTGSASRHRLSRQKSSSLDSLVPMSSSSMSSSPPPSALKRDVPLFLSEMQRTARGHSAGGAARTRTPHHKKSPEASLQRRSDSARSNRGRVSGPLARGSEHGEFVRQRSTSESNLPAAEVFGGPHTPPLRRRPTHASQPQLTSHPLAKHASPGGVGGDTRLSSPALWMRSSPASSSSLRAAVSNPTLASRDDSVDFLHDNVNSNSNINRKMGQLWSASGRSSSSSSKGSSSQSVIGYHDDAVFPHGRRCSCWRPPWHQHACWLTNAEHDRQRRWAPPQAQPQTGTAPPSPAASGFAVRGRQHQRRRR